MSAINVLSSTVKRIEQIVSTIPLEKGFGEATPFKVHRQVLPEKMSDDFDYSDESDGKNMYPFVVVQVVQGGKSQNHAPMETRILLMIGVHNEDLEGAGYDDVIACIDAILNDLNITPYVGDRFVLDGALDWSLHEENTHPFYFGGLEFKLQSETLTDNRGGLRDDY